MTGSMLFIRTYRKSENWKDDQPWMVGHIGKADLGDCNPDRVRTFVMVAECHGDNWRDGETHSNFFFSKELGVPL